MPILKGLATGIGSLPFQDASSAVELIFRFCPEIPFWPQLPKRNHREGMVAQFSERIPCLEFTPEGLLFNPRNQDQALEVFYGRVIAGDCDYFKITPEYACGLYAFWQRLSKGDLKNIEFIKIQITGPFTFAATIKNDKQVALLHDPVFMQVIIKGLIMKALWQIKFFEGFGKKIILFLDEPYLGSFGSAYTPLNREEVVKGLTELSESLKSKDILLGVHCCGNTDWSILTDIKSIDIINFDAFGFLDKFILYAENLKGFLERGGLICWGIVPTQEFSGRETAGLLVKKLKEGIDALVKKGLNKELLLENLIISPACGLGSLDPKKAEGILRLLSETSAFIRKNL